MENFKQRVDEAVGFLREKMVAAPEIVLVLGTGLSGLGEHLESPLVLPYGGIPNFPKATVPSHAGNLIFGNICDRPVAVLQGRFHYYEGYSARELTMPIRVLALLGAKTLIVSNSAGGLNPAFAAGTVMVVRDHLNFIPDNPLRGPNVDAWGPRFPDLSAPYDRRLIDTTLACAAREQIGQVATGVYVAIPGPSLETPAETRYLRQCGADAVGMSTVPEVIVAIHAGMRVLGLSVVANVNDPDNLKPIILEEIIAETRRAEDRLARLLLAVLPEI
ncbi:MAG: purine-nucleoside phosphorylase [Desulfurivibrionaceae bacterium]|nr:purine-nucleoside phosphorylase [Pseudomonadota bacterium]MBU4411926.1 purine-nucleoside phosphorylase [Pseudomonadota bacterium]MCG2823165.1 purine-nucleoside phosphorylase [Desulfobulbaceae bacterium]MDP2002939.1 purine-nucleoside phosphorylase [Desulfurivibrionaceae bacterium]PKN16919.1 MAG: purine-nucleoside phosphorylase [Deltaproteobacteria bacterium HGW-Deltaproteobacteria-3]